MAKYITEDIYIRCRHEPDRSAANGCGSDRIERLKTEEREFKYSADKKVSEQMGGNGGKEIQLHQRVVWAQGKS